MAYGSHKKGPPGPPGKRPAAKGSGGSGNPPKKMGGPPPRSSPGGGPPRQPGKRPPARPATGRQQREQEIAKVQGQRRRKRKKNYTLYYIMLAVLLTVTGVTLSLTVFFNIETIKVTGTSLYTEEQVLAAVDVKEGDNLMRLNTGRLGDDARGRLVSAENVTLKRRFPNTLEVVVEDAVAVQQILVNGKSYHISRGGRIIAIEEGAVPNIPMILGPNPSGLQLGDQLDKLAAKTEASSTDTKESSADSEENTQEKLLTSMKILVKEVEQSGLADISVMDVTDSVNLRIFYQNRFEVKLGTFSELQDKLAMFQSILSKGSLGLEESGTLDISDPDRCIAGQTAPVLPEGAGQPGWNWTGPHLENFDEFFGFAAPDAPDPDPDEPVNGEEDSSSGEPSEQNSGNGESGEASSEKTSEPSSEASSEASSETSSAATADGYQLPQMPKVGGDKIKPETSHEPAEENSSGQTPEPSGSAPSEPSSKDASSPSSSPSSEPSSDASSEGDSSPGYTMPQMPSIPAG